MADTAAPSPLYSLSWLPCRNVPLPPRQSRVGKSPNLPHTRQFWTPISVPSVPPTATRLRQQDHHGRFAGALFLRISLERNRLPPLKQETIPRRAMNYGRAGMGRRKTLSNLIQEMTSMHMARWYRQHGHRLTNSLYLPLNRARTPRHICRRVRLIWILLSARGSQLSATTVQLQSIRPPILSKSAPGRLILLHHTLFSSIHWLS